MQFIDSGVSVTYKPSPADVKTLLEAETSVESVVGVTVAVAADEDAISVLAALHPLRQAIAKLKDNNL